MQQGDDEWLAIRCGRVTASRVHDVVATIKSGGYGAGRKNYMAELVGEKLTGRLAEHYVSAAMEDGTRREPSARLAYALATGFEIEEVGFINHPRIAMAGCSPDGLVNEDGLVEDQVPRPRHPHRHAVDRKNCSRVHGSDAVPDGLHRTSMVRFRQP